MRGAGSIRNLDARGVGIDRVGSAFRGAHCPGRKSAAKWIVPSLEVRCLQ